MSKTTTPTKERLPKFEKALEELEDIVEKMEDGELNLDSALKMFEKGISISRQCQKVLQEAEQKVQILTMSEDKEPKLLDIENDTD